MAITQRIVPIHDFAHSMVDEKALPEDIAGRLDDFEKRFGSPDTDTLAVIVQASLVCRFHGHHEHNLLQTCAAIGQGAPTAIYIHRQVSPERWNETNAYVIGVQAWLGLDTPPPPEIDKRRVDTIVEWLGPDHPAKRCLGELFLSRLIEHIWNTDLACVAAGKSSSQPEYCDFGRWYLRRDGGQYATGDREAYREKLLSRARELLPVPEDDKHGNPGGIGIGLMNPLCMHRSARRLDIQLTSIGALERRGNLPPDPDPKENWARFCEEVDADLASWLSEGGADSDIGHGIHEALGEPTEMKKTVVRDFLYRGAPGRMWGWFEKKRREYGHSVGAISAASDGWWG